MSPHTGKGSEGGEKKRNVAYRESVMERETPPPLLPRCTLRGEYERRDRQNRKIKAKPSGGKGSLRAQ